mmetsp:Transcript_42145/g.83791  ORF Transcript_42145/g.83791 Transcript_42145/m.83791 type:complete len:279 (-) Transcript_42145:116-952(-)
MDAHWASMRVVTAGVGGTLWLWNLLDGSGVELGARGLGLGCIRCMAVDWSSGANDGGRALNGSDAGLLAMWDFATKRCTKVFDLTFGLISSLAVDWGKFRAFVGHGDSGLDLIALESGELITSITGHTCLVTAIAVEWSKARAVCGSGDGALVRWDVRRKEPLNVFRGHKGSISAIAADWTAEQVVSGSEDFHLRVWALRSGQCLRLFSGHMTPVRSLCVDWEAGMLVSGSAGGGVRLWEIRDGVGPGVEVKPETDVATGFENQAVNAVALRWFGAAE